MQAINLLPAKTGRQGLSLSGGNRKQSAAVLGAVALLAAVGYMGFTARQDASAAGEELAAAQADNQVMNAQLQQLLAADQQANKQEARRGVLVSLTAARINWERLIRDSVTVMPRKRVSLVKVTATSPTEVAAAPTPTTPGATAQPQTAQAVQGLHLEGLAYTQDDVAHMIARLGAVPGLGTPRVTSSDVVKRGNRWVVSFIVEIPVDQRAQDRASLTASADLTAAAQGSPAGSTAPGGMVP
ncbi:MAG: PilN domain-containing protein [Thermoleophilia bacterium]|nr:PilN domain-containing protein [Thermoleophilia bacterium]